MLSQDSSVMRAPHQHFVRRRCLALLAVISRPVPRQILFLLKRRLLYVSPGLPAEDLGHHRSTFADLIVCSLAHLSQRSSVECRAGYPAVSQQI